MPWERYIVTVLVVKVSQFAVPGRDRSVSLEPFTVTRVFRSAGAPLCGPAE